MTPTAWNGDALELCRVVVQSGLGVLLQTTLLLVGGLLCCALLSRQSPALRTLIGRTTLLAVLAAPVLSIASLDWLPALYRVSLPAPGRPVAAVAQVAAGPHVESHGGRATGTSQAAVLRVNGHGLPSRDDALGLTDESSADHRLPERATTGRVDTLATWAVLDLGLVYAAILGIWAGGALLFLCHLGHCCLRVMRLRRSGSPIKGRELAVLHEICARRSIRPPLLLSSPEVRTPILMGFRRPVIILPSNYRSELSTTHLYPILVHEVAHLVRRDCAWNLLARIACAVGWVQPLIWRLCRRLEQASEEACDLEVVRSGCNRRAYADCLLNLAQRLSPAGPELVVGSAAVPLRSSLGRRIEQILNGCPRRAAAPTPRICLSVALATALLGIASLALISASASTVRQTEPAQRARRGSDQSRQSRAPSHTRPPILERQPRRRPVASVQDLMVAAGLTPVQGPGVIVTLRDYAGARPPGVADLGRIHDRDLVLIISELWAGGAEALSIAGAGGLQLRLIQHSIPRFEGRLVLVDGAPLAAPYSIRAIGDPARLESQLRRRGGVIDSLQLANLDMIRIEAASSLTLPGYSGRLRHQYAKPLGAAMVAHLALQPDRHGAYGQPSQRQIDWQEQGALCLRETDLGELIGLSAAQRQRIEQLYRAHFNSVLALQSRFDPGYQVRGGLHLTRSAQTKFSREFGALHRQTQGRMLAVLSAEQLNRFKQVLGPPHPAVLDTFLMRRLYPRSGSKSPRWGRYGS